MWIRREPDVLLPDPVNKQTNACAALPDLAQQLATDTFFTSLSVAEYAV